MTEEISPKTSPNDALADLVVAKLTEMGFVTDGKSDEITAKLKSGTATSEDWKLWVDLALAKKQENDNDAQN